MTSLNYGLDMPYEVQLEYDAATSTNRMTILEPQRSPGQTATRHKLTPGVYMVSLTYNGAAEIALRHDGGDMANVLYVPSGTAGAPRTSAPAKISVQGTNEYLQVIAPSTGESAQATISVIPAATFDEMAESAQGVSVLSEISNLKSTKADKSTLDARVPADTSLRLDTTVGTRIFAGDEMVYGDTGWRDFTPLASETDMRRTEFRRIGDQVHITLGIPEISDTSWTPFDQGTIPSGFRHRANQTDCFVTVGNTVGEMVGVLRTMAGGSGLRYNSRSSTGGVTVYMTYISTDPWPTTLPGIPA